MVLEPLLSLRTVGSISVERITKPMKKKVLADYRAALSDGRAEICLRIGLNLRHMMNVRKHIREQATRSMSNKKDSSNEHP